MENLNIIVERLKDKDEGVRNNALNMLIDLIKQSHSGSIDTLTFTNLNDKKLEIVQLASSLPEDFKRKLFDIVSAISIIGNESDILKFRLQGNLIPLSEWGHLYVKKLIGCVIDSKEGRITEVPYGETGEVSQLCIEFLFKNNLEFEAIDFLLETENIQKIVEYVQIHNYKRIIFYLEEMKVFYNLVKILDKIYIKMGDHSRYVCNAVEQGDLKKAISYVKGVKDKPTRRQLVYILARLNVYFESDDLEEKHILSNSHVKKIYKEVIESLELDTKNINSRKNKYEKDLHKPIHQASFGPITINNGFIHVGFDNDTIFFPKQTNPASVDYESILNSDIPELITILASIGCIEMWNPEKVLEILQEHIFGETSSKKTGSLLALALSSTKMYDDNQTYLSLLTGNLQTGDPNHTIPTLMGIQSMYSGSCDESLKDILQPFLFSESPEVAFFTTFVLGSIFVGSADDELISIFMQMYLEKESLADSQFFKFHMLGLALLFFKRPDVDCCLSELETNYSKHGSILIKAFQYIRSGDPEIVENILAESFTGETDAFLESIAILGCTLIGMGDELASQMVSRISTSSLLLESPHLKSILPLCYALLYPSNPQSSILDVLEKSLNSGDSNTVIPTIFSLGVIGAGSTSGRIQKALEQQSGYFYKDPKASAILKISQGLLFLGKGLTTLSPFYYDKTVLSPKAFIGLFSTSFLLLESTTSPLLSSHFYLFYLLVQSFSPSYIYSYSKINIRIGTPVNTVGVVGEPRRITSMQTHTSPVVLGSNERAEIDEESFTSFVEDIVLLKN